MKITFLGTGTSQGVPVIGCECAVCRSMDYRDKRLRTSVHLSDPDFSVVIDSGPDFRQQMLRERIGLLDAVVLTHGHKDHIAGLDDVRAYNFKQNMDMPVFASRAVHDQVRTEFHYAFEEAKYPGIPQLALNEISTASFEIKGVRWQPLPVLHHRLPVLGFRVGDFAYVTDANAIPDETLALMKGLKVLVLNALQREKHLSHFNLEEAKAAAARIGAASTYFTHISHKLGFHGATQAELPAGMHLAYDGLTLNA